MTHQQAKRCRSQPTWSRQHIGAAERKRSTHFHIISRRDDAASISHTHRSRDARRHTTPRDTADDRHSQACATTDASSSSSSKLNRCRRSLLCRPVLHPLYNEPKRSPDQLHSHDTPNSSHVQPLTTLQSAAHGCFPPLLSGQPPPSTQRLLSGALDHPLQSLSLHTHSGFTTPPSSHPPPPPPPPHRL